MCFALALLTSLGRSPAKPAQPQRSVPAGLVTTSAAVDPDAVTFLHAGDRVDLVETYRAGDERSAPTVVAHGVHVLGIRTGSEPGAAARSAQLLVAAAPADAVRIAAHQGDQVLAATIAPP